MAGSIGIAPSANLNPERDFPSMFEPVHGSAPDIAGRGIANPLGAVWSGALMLEHLGHPEAADEVTRAIAGLLADDGPRTADLGGAATTEEVTEALVAGSKVLHLVDAVLHSCSDDPPPLHRHGHRRGARDARPRGAGVAGGP